MRNKKEVRKHWLVFFGGILLAALCGAGAWYFFDISKTLAADIALLVTVPFFIWASVILFKRRKKLVVPKYPQEKRINKTIRIFPFVDIALALAATFKPLVDFKIL